MSKQESARRTIERFTKARGEMLKALREARTVIGDELESKKRELAMRLGEGKTMTVLPYAGSAGKGKLTKNNDRELFHWNGVAVEDGEQRREYLIDLFCNEVDPKSHNFHSQIGRFQFAALLPGKNSPHEAMPDAGYRFNEGRLENSNQSLCDHGEDLTELEPFDPEELVKDFMDFVIEKEQGSS